MPDKEAEKTPENAENTLKQLSQALFPDNTVTREEFLEAYNELLSILKGKEQDLTSAIEQLNTTIAGASRKMQDDNAQMTESARQELAQSIQNALSQMDTKLSQVRDGRDGTRGPRGKPGKPGRDGSPDSAQDIVQKLQSLSGEARLSASAIKGLERVERDVKDLKNRPVGGVSGRDIFLDIDISDDLDGATKTFNIQAVHTIISVDLSSFPYGSLRKSVDYTWTPTTITFTDQIDASTQLASGQSCIITAVSA